MGNKSIETGLYYIFLGAMLLSTPAIMFYVFFMPLMGWIGPFSDLQKQEVANVNTVIFSTGMVGLYFYPFVLGLPFKQALKKATNNWVIWLSCFTEIAFQIPHNLAVKQLWENHGSVFEWPFWSYGLADKRWCDYHNGQGLDPIVWLINWNDAFGGICVALCFFFGQKNSKWFQFFVLVTLFRDATLFRETVEYMWDHHRNGYPYSVEDPNLRTTAIFGLWMVNIVWLIAPIGTLIWAFLVLKKEKKK